MKYTQFLAAAAMASVASAHATLWEMQVDGVSAGSDGRGTYIRAPKNNSPLKDLTSNDLRCNVGGGSAVARTIEVKAGAKITLEWHHDSDAASDDTIDASHKGPVLTYIAPAASNGAGNVWVKLAEDGYSGGAWAVDRLKAAKGAHSFTLPATLANGEYLLRDEIIAHHESDVAYTSNPARGAQLYMGCVQIKVVSGGAATLPAGVAIPGVYTSTDPGIVFNLYGRFTSYPIPGPAVWNAASGGAATQAASTTLRTTTRPAAVPTTTGAAVTTTTRAAVPTTTSRPAVPTTTRAAACSATSKKACPVKSTTKAAAPVASGVVGTATKWGQCGGIGFTGSKGCVAGLTCTKKNDWYYQCL